MLAFTQSRQDGESKFNLMAQNHAHINYMAQQQKELLEQQAATIQAGTDMVLAAQKTMLETMESKQKENQRENDSRVRELMEKLAEMEMTLTKEKIRCLEFEAALTIERQNKRRAIDSPEDARGGKTRFTAGPTKHVDPNSTPGRNSSNSVATTQRVCPITGNSYTVLPTVSASGLLSVSRKFSPPLLSSARSRDRKPPQEMIDAMMAPPPIPSSQQIQPAIQPFQPVILPYQPVVQQASQQPVHPRFNRPTKYSRTIITVQGYHRTEEHINQSVGAWKKKLQDQGRYLPESGTLSEETRASNLRQLSSALKSHFTWWASYQNEGVHEDRHRMFKFLQATFNIPKRYENPDHWYPNQQKNALHCIDYRCVSVWWYYDQAMRDIPGFQHNETRSTTRTNQQPKQPRWASHKIKFNDHSIRLYKKTLPKRQQFNDS